MTKDRTAEWEELYDALLQLLSRWGRNQDMVDPDDYLVVSDDWGGWSHKVCITNPGLPVEEMCKSIQALLEAKFERWNVIVVFSDGTNREGLRLYHDRIITESEDPEYIAH